MIDGGVCKADPGFASVTVLGGLVSKCACWQKGPLSCLYHYDSKLFSLSKLHVIEPFKSYMEATPSVQVDQLWTKVECYSHTRESEISQPEL